MIQPRLSLCSFLLIAIFCCGCASVNTQVRGLVSNSDSGSITTPRFSEQESIRVDSNRQYKRMNRERFEEEAEVKEGAGSLWVMEGQGAYLFSQNQMRMVGDLLNVRIDGGPRSQLNTKTRVIGKLLERLESPSRQLASAQQADSGAGAAKSGAGAGKQDGNSQAGPGPGPDAKPGDAQSAKSDGPFQVDMVPTRIVEQLKDGSYRVRGIQPFMIGKREYKVIVTGIVRPEDFDDNGISAERLLDPQFDIVSSRKGASL